VGYFYDASMKSGNFTTFAAIRRASSLLSSLAAERRSIFSGDIGPICRFKSFDIGGRMWKLPSSSSPVKQILTILNGSGLIYMKAKFSFLRRFHEVPCG
jgi:hypothetical protein